MPADIRKLAQEAVELSSGESLSWDALDCEFPGDVVITYPDGHTETFYAWEHARFIAHAGTHYATIARALIEALDNYQFMVDRAANEKLDGYRELGARAAAAENDRDALLADLPHALNTCGCKESFGYVPGTEFSGPGYSGGVACAHWPEAHTAAIARLEAKALRPEVSSIGREGRKADHG